MVIKKIEKRKVVIRVTRIKEFQSNCDKATMWKFRILFFGTWVLIIGACFIDELIRNGGM